MCKHHVLLKAFPQDKGEPEGRRRTQSNIPPVSVLDTSTLLFESTAARWVLASEPIHSMASLGLWWSSHIFYPTENGMSLAESCGGQKAATGQLRTLWRRISTNSMLLLFLESVALCMSPLCVVPCVSPFCQSAFLRHLPLPQSHLNTSPVCVKRRKHSERSC